MNTESFRTLGDVHRDSHGWARDFLIGKNVAFGQSSKTITTEFVIAHVAVAFQIAEKNITSGSRRADLMLPRQIAMYLARELTEYSTPRLARSFCKKDHTTILYAHSRVVEQMAASALYAGEVETLRALIVDSWELAKALPTRIA